VTGLSSLTRLKTFHLGFDSPQSLPDTSSRRPPSLRRADLPALTHFRIRGVNGYIEDFVARINSPLLHYVNTESFFDQLPFDISQLAQFIGRVENIKVHQVQVHFYNIATSITLSTLESTIGGTIHALNFSFTWSARELSSPAEVCRSLLSSLRLSSLERLDIFILDKTYD